MKAISGIVVIILILMISVSMTSLAYIFFTQVMASTIKTGSESLETATTSLLSKMEIESITTDGHVYVRNMGTVNLKNFSVYVNDIIDTGITVTPSVIPPGGVGDINLQNSLNPGDVVRITNAQGVSATASIAPSGGYTCIPSCIGKNCGDDGCGGSCGTCTPPQTCNATGQCVSTNWFSGWTYRKQHNITGTTGAGTNYTIMITVINGTGTDSGGTVYINNKMKSDFSDIRFTNSSSSLYSYWNQTVNIGKNATFWVKISDDLSSNVVTYIYYNNTSASSIANGNKTFYWFDNCSSASGWTIEPGSVGGTVSSDGNILNITNTTSGSIPRWYKNVTFPTTYALVARTKTGAYGSSYQDQTFTGVLNSTYVEILENSIYPNGEASPNYHYYCYILSGGHQYPSTRPSPVIPTNTWFIFQMKSNSTTKTMFDLLTDNWGAWDSPSSTHDAANPTAVAIGTYTGSAYFDWIFIRKFVQPEPANGAWGSEESGG